MKRRRTGRVRAPHQCGWISLLAAGLLAVAFLGHSAGAQAVPLTTLAEVQDGMVQDIAGQSDASGDPYAARVWLAQGRVRWAIRAADRQRKIDENLVFDDVNPGSNEQILAIELDENRQQIWTLTESAIYRETYASPYSPSQPLLECHLELACMHTCPPPPASCLLEHHMQSWEEPIDLKVWHGGPGSIDWVFVLTTKRIIAIRSDTSLNPAVLEYHSSAIELFQELDGGWFTSTIPGDPINPLKVSHLHRLRIQEDLDGRLMAYVLAKMSGYKKTPESEDRSVALVMLCDLDKGGQFDSPTFDVDPGPGRSYFYFNPVPVPPDEDPTDEKLNNNTALGLDVFTAGSGNRHMYVACGMEKQIQYVDVTNAFTAGIGTSVQIDVGSTEEDHMRNVLVDPLAPEDRFFAVAKVGFFVHVPNDPVSCTENELFGEGCERDMIHVLLPADPPPPSGPPWMPSVWTAVENVTDHVCKVMDVSTNDHPVELVDEYYGISSCDGAVAIPPYDVYLPTFAGVVRYTETTTPPYVFHAVPDSYMPAEYPLGSGNVEHTEHIEIGHMPQQANPYRLFTASNKGDFMEFEIEAATRNPLPPRPFVPDAGDLQAMGWAAYLPQYIATAQFYGNDVVFLDLDQEYYVLTNLTNRNVGGQEQRQHAVLAYKWNGQSLEWQHMSTAMTPIIDGTNADSKYVNRLVLSTSKEFAFCTFPQGFFVVDLRGLAATPPQHVLVPQVVFVETPRPPKKRGVGGIAQSKDRLFAYVNAPAGHNEHRQVRIYEWNEATGYVNDIPGQTYKHEHLGFSSVFPNALPKVYNGRFLVTDPASGAGYVHFAAGPELIQLEWPGNSANTLSFTGYWRSDYPKDLQDCRSYEFGANPGDDTRILVVKNSEAFALVKP